MARYKKKPKVEEKKPVAKLAPAKDTGGRRR